jgi:ACR3 family arsenite efflux pump ArsB
MSLISLVLMLVATYAVISVCWYVVALYMEWYQGNHITVGDLVDATLIMVLWPMVILDIIRQYQSDYGKQHPDYVPINKRVIIKGRLDARVERALRE